MAVHSCTWNPFTRRALIECDAQFKKKKQREILNNKTFLPKNFSAVSTNLQMKCRWKVWRTQTCKTLTIEKKNPERTTGKVGTDQTADICLKWDARVTIIQNEGYRMLIACLVVEIIQRWICLAAKPLCRLVPKSTECYRDVKLILYKPLWPCIKAKVMDTSMSMYAMKQSTVMPNLNVIA